MHPTTLQFLKMDETSLSCSICSKKPHFSDMSHLLTHIASKAHLANYFKLQVKSRHDAAAHQTLTQYDHWYQTNHLAKLLSDRMAMSSKTIRKRRSAGLVEYAGSIKTETVDQTTPASLDGADLAEDQKSQWLFAEDNIDPRLSDPRRLIHDDSMYNMTYTAPSTLSESFERPFVKLESNTLYDWNEIRANGGVESSPFNHHQGERYRCPLRSRIPTTPPPPMYSPSLPDSKLHVVGEQRIDDMTRLKGIQWPGMDVFDAATDLMKRQRNQKKDASTFKAMEEASGATEPNEMVFSPSGILRREREITGYVEDDDPLPGEWRIPKPRRDRRDTRDRRDRRNQENHENTAKRGDRPNGRVALSDSDPNRAILGGRVTKKAHRPKRQTVQEHENQDSKITDTSSNKRRHNRSNGPGCVTKKENDDFQLSMDAAGQSSRLQVFKDHDQPAAEPEDNSFASDIMDTMNTSHGEPFGMTYYQPPGDAINTLLAASDHEHFPSSLNQSGLRSTHDYSHDYASIAGTHARSIEGVYLVDASSGSNGRGPYDPLIGGSVLHYRWDWHESEPGRADANANDPILGSGLHYNREPSSGSTIYEDEAESKSRLWLDGVCV